MRKLILFVQLFIAVHCLCQEVQYSYGHKRFTTEDGLPDMHIQRLFQDSKGYLWAGTRNGLSRFNGSQFQNYFKFNGLADNSINEIIESSNKIILLTAYGLSFLSGDSIHTYKLPDNLKADFFSYILQVKDSIYLFNMLGFNSSISHFAFDIKHKTFTRISSLPPRIVLKVFADEGYGGWVFNNAGQVFQKKGNGFVLHAKIADTLNEVCAIGKNYFAVSDPGKHQLLFFNAAENKITGAHQFKEYLNLMKRNMIAFDSTRIFYTTSFHDIYAFVKGQKNAVLKTKDGYFDMLIDNRKNLWVASSNGLYNIFSQNFTEISFPDFQNGGEVQGIVQDDNGKMWFGSFNNGIWCINSKLVAPVPVESVINLRNAGYKQYPQIYPQASKIGNHIFFPATEGILAVSAQQARFIKTPWDVCFGVREERSSGNIYTGTSHGIKRLLKYDSLLDLSAKTFLNSLPVAGMYNDNAGNVIVVNQKGAYKIQHDTLSPFLPAKGIAVSSLAQDSSGNYLIGTPDGLYLSNDTLKKRIAPGIIKGVISNLLVYNKQYLVCTALQNLFIIDLDALAKGDELVYQYNRYSGFIVDDIVTNTMMKDNAGNIWLSAFTKTIMFNLPALLYKNSPPQVFLNDFSFSNDLIKWRSYLHVSENVKLASEDGNVRIGFLSVMLTNPDEVFYQYRLKGLNDEWGAPTKDKAVTFTNLGKGDYLFEVRSSLDGLHWTNETTAISFYIPPHWWQTWWFYLLSLTAAALLLWLLIKYYTNIKLKEQKRHLEKELAIQIERQRISAEMHDDIGAGLFGARLQTELLKKKITDPEALENVTTIHSSISDISTKVREVIWSLNAENDTLFNLISFIHQQAHRMFANASVELNITSSDSIPSYKIDGEKRRHIYLTVNEALHNILKHANATTAKINFTYTSNLLNISVEDNGKGFENGSTTVESMGLQTMKDRVKKLNGNLNIASSSSGTKLTISIPL